MKHKPAQFMQDQVIALNKEHLLGEGTTRRVYVDPLDPTRCIKVDIKDRPPNQSPTFAEAKFYKKFNKRLAASNYHSIPHFFGIVQTSQGLGGVFELIRNETDNKVAPTLQSFIEQSYQDSDYSLLEKALESFKHTMLSHMIISTDLKSHNICVQSLRSGEYRLVCIDGLGNKEFIPVSSYIRIMAHKKLKRHFTRYHLNSLDDLLANAHTHEFK